MNNSKSSCRQFHWFISALNREVRRSFHLRIRIQQKNSEELWIIILRIRTVICLKQFIGFVCAGITLLIQRNKRIHLKKKKICIFVSGIQREYPDKVSFVLCTQNGFNPFFFNVYQLTTGTANRIFVCWWKFFAATDSAHLIYMRRAIIRFNKSRDTEPLKSKIITCKGTTCGWTKWKKTKENNIDQKLA